MARPAPRLTDVAARAFGRGVALYSRGIVAAAVTEIRHEAPLSSRPVVFIGWHEGNLLALALHAKVRRCAAIAFVPPGPSGAAMTGWLEGLGIAPVALAADARRGLGLRAMEAALAGGKDVLIAVDGPRGPRHRVAPGALWLAHAAGVEVRPFGCAAWPCLRLPRWDRLIVPLPGARIAAAVGTPVPFSPRQERTAQDAGRVAAALARVETAAQAAVLGEHQLRATEAAPWR
jgi:lysophospholipid acyltransferase (LPLAT)-like uncharacterized protein